MSREVSFTENVTVVHADFLNGLQEGISGLALNAVVAQSSSTGIIVVGSTNEQEIGLIIDGVVAFSTSSLTYTFSGSSGTRDLYAQTPAASGSPPTYPRTISLTDVTHGSSAPAGNSRKIAEVDWSGTAITAVRSMASPAPTNSPNLTGAPTAPTQAYTDNSTLLATTAYVHAILDTFCPIGTIIERPFSSAPNANFLALQGQAITSSWPDLRAKLIAAGSLWGVDGSGNPLLEDRRGRVPIMVGTHAENNALGKNDGITVASRRMTHTHTHSHTHTMASHVHSTPTHHHSAIHSHGGTFSGSGTGGSMDGPGTLVYQGAYPIAGDGGSVNPFNISRGGGGDIVSAAHAHYVAVGVSGSIATDTYAGNTGDTSPGNTGTPSPNTSDGPSTATTDSGSGQGWSTTMYYIRAL